MDDLAFADHIAALCRRDGCTDVRRVTGTGGLGADVTGCLPDGRKVVVQCGRETGRGPADAAMCGLSTAPLAHGSAPTWPSSSASACSPGAPAGQPLATV